MGSKFCNQCYGEDALFNFDVILASKILIINDNDSYCYIRHPSSIVNSKSIDNIDTSRLIDELRVSCY